MANPPASAVDRIIEPIRVEQEQLQARKDELTEQLAQVNLQMRVFNRILNAAQPPEPKQKKRVANGNGKAPSMSEEKLNIARALFPKVEMITGPDLAKASRGKLNKDQANKALQVLRESGEIRMTGMHRPPGTKGLGRKVYAVVQ